MGMHNTNKSIEFIFPSPFKSPYITILYSIFTFPFSKNLILLPVPIVSFSSSFFPLLLYISISNLVVIFSFISLTLNFFVFHPLIILLLIFNSSLNFISASSNCPNTIIFTCLVIFPSSVFTSIVVVPSSIAFISPLFVTVTTFVSKDLKLIFLLLTSAGSIIGFIVISYSFCKYISSYCKITSLTGV